MKRLLLSLLATPCLCQAAVVASYDFEGNTLTSSDTDPISTASDIVRIDNAPVNPTGDRLRVGADLTPDEDGWSSTGTGYSFTFTPGGTISLASLTFDYGLLNAYHISGNYGDYTVRVFSSLTGTATVGDAIHTYTPALVESSSQYFGPENQVIDLTMNPLFEDISGPVTFGIYVTDNHSGDTRYHTIDNIVLNTVPEPSTAILGAIGALCLLRRRRAS